MDNNTGRTAAYLRVSTGSHNLAPQEEITKEATKVFREHASASSRRRPELENMMKWVREGDLVIVYSIDRIARNVVDLRSIVDELTEKGVSIEFVKENLRFEPRGHAISDLLLGAIGSVAEFERSLMVEKQREANEKARADGRPVGRPRVMTDELVERAAERVEMGVPIARVARDLGVARTTLSRELMKREVVAA